MVGHSEDGFCTKPTAHGNRQQRWGGAGVRSGKHRRLGGTATTATGDSRRGAGNGGNGSAGVSRVLSFLREAAGGSLPVLPGGSAPVRWRIEGQRGKQQPREGRPGPAQKLPQASWPRRKKWETPPIRPPTPSTPEADTRAPAATAAGGDGRQPRREHRGGTDSRGTLAGRVFRVEPPEHSLLTEPPMQRAKSGASRRHRLRLW